MGDSCCGGWQWVTVVAVGGGGWQWVTVVRWVTVVAVGDSCCGG